VKLIDTSSWIHALRKTGDPVVRERVRSLLMETEAAWCDVVRVELWQGVKKKVEADFLKQLEANLTLLPMDKAVWDLACQLGNRSRAAGKPVPTTDLLIAACSIAHNVELEHCDRHFDAILHLVGK
jgi:predicted nucleic acid-binding protein